jgi:tetratricopeptide (TPR) repeat protein
MTRITSLTVSFGLVAALAGAQAPPAPPAPPAPVVSPALPPSPPLPLDFDAIFRDVDAALDSVYPQAVAAAGGGQELRALSASADYDRGTSALDSGRYDRAVEAFDKVIAANGPKADGAMYWKAYALNRLGKRTEAAAVIDELLKKFPSSRWAGDAKVLRFDVQRAAGQPAQPEKASDEEMKLIALNSLVASDPDRGIPMVEQILNGSASPRMKERALFVLAQSASPRAKALLADFARGSKGNPDLQMKALEYLGAFRGGPDVGLLLDVYRSTSDPDVKRRVIRSLSMAGRHGLAYGYAFSINGDDLLGSYARSTADYGRAMEEARATLDQVRADLEKDLQQEQRDRIRLTLERAQTELERQSATSAAREKEREAKAKEAGNALWQLYQSETSIDLRREILRNLRFPSETDHLLQIARTEGNPLLRQSAVQGLLVDRTPQSLEMMLTLYRNEKDPGVRRQIVDSVSSMPGSAGTLVQMARQETDPALRKRIVERLSTMKDKEAVDYMMEILKK